jgi:hypothetical protein
LRKDWKYIVYIGLAIALYAAVNLMAPKQFNWTVTLAHDDKDPYGTFVFNELLPSIFKAHEITLSNQTIYELKDSLKHSKNLVIISSSFSGDKPDSDVLLEQVSNGANVFISASYFWGHFSDTLQVSTYDYAFTTEDGAILHQKDTSHLKFASVSLDTTQHFNFKIGDIPNYFQKFDTTRTTVIARNVYNQPVTIRVNYGKGNFILNCTPLALTNVYMLYENNSKFISSTLSYLPQRDVIWTEYYQLGRRESNSPLRFILTNESLSWAYYLTIGSIIIFMIFEAKRKQRIIPVLRPPANTSLEFVSTIGNLYYQHGDHKNMAEKKVNYLLDQIRSRYFLRTNEINDDFISQLASKSGNSKDEVLMLFNTINYISSSTIISPGQLVDLNEKIERFLAGK